MIEKVKTIIFDIETVGFDFDSFDKIQQEYLMKFAEKEETEEKKEEKKKEVLQQLNLSALTAQIVAIGMFNVETGKTLVLFQSEKNEDKKSEDGLTEYRTGTEKEILTNFWKIANNTTKFVTFNGRNFDAPFIYLRSGILKVKSTKNLLPYRFDSKLHCDLLDQLSFYGATKKFNLDFYCKAFGIETPKGGNVTGHNINESFKAGKFFEIAEYCGKDLKATFELYDYYTKYIEITN